MERDWIAVACPNQTDLISLHEKRVDGLKDLLLQSLTSIQTIEKELADRAQQEEHMVNQPIIFHEMTSHLTSLQIQCLQERRNFIALVGENEQIKLENEDLRRKFHAALLLGRIDEKAVIHFLQKNPKAPNLTNEIIRLTEKMKTCDGEKKTKYDLQNPVVLAQQVQFLEKHLEDIKEQNFVEVYSLKKTLKHAEGENNLIKTNYESRLKEMANRLHDCRALIHKTTGENLKFQKRMLMAEEDWTREHKMLVNRLAEVTEMSVASVGKSTPSQYHHVHKHKDLPALQKQLLEKLSRAEIQLLETQNTCKEYEMKFLQLERKMHRIRDEEAKMKQGYSEAVKKLKSKNDTLEKRFDKINERRKLDNIGFQQDIKSLRQFLATIEKKLQLFMYRSTSTKNQENSPTLPPSSESGNLNKGNIIQRLDVGDGADLNRRGGKGVLKCRNSTEMKNPALDLKEGLGDAQRDRLVYEMLSKVLRSAQNQVDQIEGGLSRSMLGLATNLTDRY